MREGIENQIKRRTFRGHQNTKVMEVNHTPMRMWAEDDKPREKFLLKGKAALSDAELLALLIGSGSSKETAVALSKRILAANQNNLGLLGKRSISQLMAFNGIGTAKAVTIAAALELGQRRRKQEALVQLRIQDSKTVFELMQPEIGNLGHEEFWAIFINNSNRVIGKSILSRGGITGTIVDVRLLLKAALEHEAVGVIVCHNHPSGKLQPSDQDLDLTNRIRDALQTIDMQLLDHLIITEYDYYSFCDADIL